MMLKITISFLLFVGLALSDKIPGLDATCVQGNGDCSMCQTPPYGTWINGKLNKKCAINQCDTSRKLFAQRSVSDEFCSSCPTDLDSRGTHAQQIYANYDRSFCVGAQNSCTNRKGFDWTDFDCDACGHPDGKFAKADKTGCTSSVSIAGKAVPCQSNNSCDECPQYTSFNWVLTNGSQKNCQLYSYLAAIFPKQYLTDLMCSSNPDLANTNLFASMDQSICVNTPAIVGNPVPCQKNGNCDNCPAYTGFSWQLTKNSQTHCQISSCFANNFPSQGLTDLFCGSCPQDFETKKRTVASKDQRNCDIPDPEQTDPNQPQDQKPKQQQSFNQLLSFSLIILSAQLIYLIL
ncbi:cell surface immobilization antigen (macronuclear) [Tetrahymena thermophila SB210]|uniref:Cell surface immobilization antigen n=1 Tax=Tetrahymena thermophila (strain SB210) TaxID=312017 RepID=Q23J67_TETTS|nr:cell surface immobilization antigen [Tetrahymena thermophila SB210]EAR96637.1 cell surface immobilization antigen [Tetrahymena thermophila SB210]|eukprot:XP_001016882.1 cell surface immobilization antigen [Tetrahymena thermophila SB210]